MQNKNQKVKSSKPIGEGVKEVIKLETITTTKLPNNDIVDLMTIVVRGVSYSVKPNQTSTFSSKWLFKLTELINEKTDQNLAFPTTEKKGRSIKKELFGFLTELIGLGLKLNPTEIKELKKLGGYRTN